MENCKEVECWFYDEKEPIHCRVYISIKECIAQKPGQRRLTELKEMDDTNKKIYKWYTERHEKDKKLIKRLEKLIHEQNIKQ